MNCRHFSNSFKVIVTITNIIVRYHNLSSKGHLTLTFESLFTDSLSSSFEQFFTSIFVFLNDISITKSFSFFQVNEQIRKIIESEMFYEIKKCKYHDVDDFFEKYFEEQFWSRTRIQWTSWKELNCERS